MRSKFLTTKGGGKLSPPLPDPDLAKWCEALAAVTAPADTVPPGWRTAKQIATQTKTPVPTLQNKLKRLVAAGKAERKKFRVQLAKNVRPVPHYKLK
jgi:hypothetical protein